MTERTVRCEDCRFWVEHYEGVGECRRYPPQLPTRMIVEFLGGEDDPDDPWRGEWPEVSRNAWCGEFVKREPEYLLPSEATIEGEVRE